MTISIGRTRFMARGMPSGMQVWTGSSPEPPLATSARLASNLAWYSAVRGACWPRAGGLVESKTPSGPTRSHWPAIGGYLFSSNGCCAATGPAITATTSATEPITLRNNMLLLPMAYCVLDCGRPDRLFRPEREKERAGRLRSQQALRLRRCDQAAVLEFDLRRLVRAAFRAAVQRIDGHSDLVPRLQALGSQSLAHLQARRAALQNPILLDAIVAFDRHDQDGVGADKPELLHGPRDFLRVQGIEHGKRMMRRGGRAHCQEGGAHQQSCKLRFHASSPLSPFRSFSGAAPGCRRS